MKQREKALELIGELEKEGIVETVLQQGMSIKGLKGKQYKQLEQLSTMIFLTYKNDIAKVGQAMTAPEQAIVEKVMPQQTLATVTLGELQTALEALPELMATEAYGLQMGRGIMPTQRDINFEEFVGMYGQQQPTKEVPGVKKVTD